MNKEIGAIEETYPVVKKPVPTFYFIGVTTGKSSIMKVFPLWMKVLGREDVILEGVDCKIHDEPENYRRAVAQIKYDPLSVGTLVTTHKIDLLNAARDMFEYLDPYAVITGEVSSISKLEGHFRGEPGCDYRKRLFWENQRTRSLLWSGWVGCCHSIASDQ